MNNTILKTQDLRKEFQVRVGFLQKERKITAVDNVNLNILQSETIGLVGESGCGKTTLGRILAGLLSPTSGRFFYKEKEITEIGKKKNKQIRREIQMVFQDPFSSLNPRMTVSDILSRPLKVFKIGKNTKERTKIVLETLESVGMKTEHMSRYPHEFSGGQRQRIAVARSLIVNPDFIILDEPTSALDVSVQAQILNLLVDIKTNFKLTMLLITHDLSVARFQCDRIAVMYMGRIVEVSDKEALFTSPAHPYTRILLKSIPRIDPNQRREKAVSTGEVPSLLNPPPGCYFAPRCPLKMDICETKAPELKKVNKHQTCACFAVENKR